VHLSPDGGIRQIEMARYTYCQGVYLGACVELASWALDGEPAIWAGRAARTVEAVAEHFTVPVPVGASARYEIRTTTGAASGAHWDAGGDGAGRSARVLRGQGGGDGGLFAGILARYLARAALVLPDFGPAFAPAAALAADLVFDSAHAAWARQVVGPDGPVFGPEWSGPAVGPQRSDSPEADLSVQTGAWMLFEAAATLARSL
jgi:predicted alpha-1,6-mannanase (GH76 family)